MRSISGRNNNKTLREPDSFEMELNRLTPSKTDSDKDKSIDNTNITSNKSANMPSPSRSKILTEGSSGVDETTHLMEHKQKDSGSTEERQEPQQKTIAISHPDYFSKKGSSQKGSSTKSKEHVSCKSVIGKEQSAKRRKKINEKREKYQMKRGSFVVSEGDGLEGVPQEYDPDEIDKIIASMKKYRHHMASKISGLSRMQQAKKKTTKMKESAVKINKTAKIYMANKKVRERKFSAATKINNMVRKTNAKTKLKRMKTETPMERWERQIDEIWKTELKRLNMPTTFQETGMFVFHFFTNFLHFLNKSDYFCMFCMFVLLKR